MSSERVVSSARRGKSSFQYVCHACGCRAPKWMGKCPDCGEFGTLLEEREGSRAGVDRSFGAGDQPTAITEVNADVEERVVTGLLEFDRVLGGGIIPGSVILIGGEPGIGKSTLLLQVGGMLASDGHRVLYVSGEESAKQTKLRGERLGINSESLLIYPETCLEEIMEKAEYLKPPIMMVDSVQTVFSQELDATPGTVSQLREVTSRLITLAKGLDITVFLVGHVTKEGILAGPKLLEHMVDTVLYFEGEGTLSFRILRAAKNRFGSTNEIGVFEMRSEGLRDVNNPSELFLAERPLDVSGSVVVAPMEGTRPLLLELQALVTSSNLANPRRMATGLDTSRVSLLVAILEKKLGLNLQNEDIFLNVAGGTRIEEPAADLGVATAIASSFKDQPVDPHTVVIGEVGLAGEVRAVPHMEARLKEARKLGFKRCIIPAKNRTDTAEESAFQRIAVNSVAEALEEVLY